MSAADVTAAARGDSGAYGRLVARHQGAVCGVALAIVGDVAASEDVAQEVFVTAWRKLSTLQQPESFGPWVRQMARNLAMTARRGARRYDARVTTDGDAVERAGDGGEQVHLEAEERRLLQEAIDALPDGARDVMILFYREGRSVAHVAELLELSEDAVKKRLSRARAAVTEDVRARLEQTLVRTAPTAALTAAVLTAIAPAPALAAGAVAAAKGSKALAAGVWGAGLLAIVLGYRLGEAVTRPDRLGELRRARDLTLAGLVAAGVGTALGPVGMVVGMLVFIALVTWVQLRVLPVAFELTEAQAADPRARRAERIGRLLGVIGLVLGAACGLYGVLAGWGG